MATDRSDGSYPRESIELGRVAFFCDAVYATALTLLVTSLDVPDIVEATNAGDLWSALGQVRPRIITLFISFVVIGSFWLAHHHFVRRLRAVSRPLVLVTMAYLAFVAFLPFPSAILGAYNNPATLEPVAMFLVSIPIACASPTLAIVSWFLTFPVEVLLDRRRPPGLAD